MAGGRETKKVNNQIGTREADRGPRLQPHHSRLLYFTLPDLKKASHERHQRKTNTMKGITDYTWDSPATV